MCRDKAGRLGSEYLTGVSKRLYPPNSEPDATALGLTMPAAAREFPVTKPVLVLCRAPELREASCLPSAIVSSLAG